jgi:L-ascorbate metabolism protein UlaG (beta-lactamase superfamily)
MSITITLIGGPTALIEDGGLRLLTDPTFGRRLRILEPGVATAIA